MNKIFPFMIWYAAIRYAKSGSFRIISDSVEDQQYYASMQNYINSCSLQIINQNYLLIQSKMLYIASNCRKLTYQINFLSFVFIVFQIMKRIRETQSIKLNLWHKYLLLYRIRTTNFYKYALYRFLISEGKKRKHTNFATSNAL